MPRPAVLGWMAAVALAVVYAHDRFAKTARKA